MAKKPSKPPRILIYGIEGVGKSSFIDGAPNPTAICPEGGFDTLDNVHEERGIKTWDDLRATVKRMIAEPKKFSTLGLDSADWIEKLAHQKIVGASGKTIITVAGGYGSGYRQSEMMHKELIDDLAELREKHQMIIIVTAHYQVKEVRDPDAIADYDQFEIKCHEMVSSLWREWVDALLFCRFETFVKDGGDDGKTVAKGTGNRIMFTEKRPAFQAKNRYGLPPQINDVSYHAFEEARKLCRIDSVDVLRAEALTLSDSVLDEEMRLKVIDTIANATGENMLNAIIARIKKVVAT